MHISSSICQEVVKVGQFNKLGQKLIGERRKVYSSHKLGCSLTVQRNGCRSPVRAFLAIEKVRSNILSCIQGEISKRGESDLLYPGRFSRWPFVGTATKTIAIYRMYKLYSCESTD